jgi:nanoRNase/pAp phosphatase (c-di-AMP/oligoRNAs hydrolase)
MIKRNIQTVHERNAIIANIIGALQERSHFLIMGHRNPDEDCIASMVAFALIVSKFSKKADLYIGDQLHDHFQYLLNICAHNGIYCCGPVSAREESIDAIVFCDTPKPSMVSSDPQIDALREKPGILKIEIDHHLETDSSYIGDEGHCLVAEANSSSELVGLIALKLRKRGDLLKKYNIHEVLSRNVVLAVLTGIISDTNMGQYIKSRRARRYYEMFTGLYNSLLMKETTKESNLMNKEEIFREIQRLSTVEEECFQYINAKKRFSESIGYVVLDRHDMEHLARRFDKDTIVSVSRAIADSLAEESSRLGLIAYDDTASSNLIQFRLRRSQRYKSFDVRKVLELFSIADGGGHEGAIAFRISGSRIDDLERFVNDLVSGIGSAITGRGMKPSN